MVYINRSVILLNPKFLWEEKLVIVFDASHVSNNGIYWQTSTICAIISEYMVGQENIIHPLSGSSCKQIWVIYASVGSEILATADADYFD